MVFFILNEQTSWSTYIENTDYESYTYYFALGYQPNKKHNFQFTITSAPQWHDQRSYSPTIKIISNTILIMMELHTDNTTLIGDITQCNGNKVALANRANYYSKPVMMLTGIGILRKIKLSTVAYMSNGRGGGTGELGKVGGKGLLTLLFLMLQVTSITMQFCSQRSC
jgi:hypothetical protein